MSVYFDGVPLLVGGIDVIVNDDIPIGRPVRTPSFLIAHPLDTIALIHGRDLHGRLDAAMREITTRALDAIDAAIWRVLR